MSPAEHERAQLEIEQIRANISKLIAETSKLIAEQRVIRRWEPVVFPAGFAALIAALTATALKAWGLL